MTAVATSLQLQESQTENFATPELDRTEKPLVVGLNHSLAARPEIIGHRAERLSRATRAGLPIPSGSVLTSAALGSIEHRSERASMTSAEALADVFGYLGRGGRVPLTISVSVVSRAGTAADHIAPTRSITTLSELLHTVRRLSATASLLGEEIAVVVQHDLDTVATGTLKSSTSSRRVRDSIAPAVDPVDEFRLIELGQKVACHFMGERTITWAVDQSNRPWILDIGPSL